MTFEPGERVLIVPLDPQNVGGWAKVVSDEDGRTHVDVEFEDRPVNVATPRETVVNRHVGEYIDALEQRALMQARHEPPAPGWLSVTLGTKDEVLCGEQKVRGVQEVVVVKAVREPVKVWLLARCAVSIVDRAPGE